MAMRKGLGKGLGALIEDFNEQPNTPGEGAVTLPLQKIAKWPGGSLAFSTGLCYNS